jgi:hypothetical protein
MEKKLVRICCFILNNNMEFMFNRNFEFLIFVLLLFITLMNDTYNYVPKITHVSRV